MGFTQYFNSLFSPMPQKYCSVFYGFSLIQLLGIIVLSLNFIYMLRDIKRNTPMLIHTFIYILLLIVNYIYNRLLFNMCLK